MGTTHHTLRVASYKVTALKARSVLVSRQGSPGQKCHHHFISQFLVSTHQRLLVMAVTETIHANSAEDREPANL